MHTYVYVPYIPILSALPLPSIFHTVEEATTKYLADGQQSERERESYLILIEFTAKILDRRLSTWQQQQQKHTKRKESRMDLLYLLGKHAQALMCLREK